MPVVVAWVATAVVYAGGGAAWSVTVANAIGAFATWSAIAKVAFTVGSLVYTRAQQKKALKGLNSMDTTRTLNLREPVATRKLVVGETRIGGTMVFAHQSGTNGEYTHVILVHAWHECEGFQAEYLNNEAVTLDGDGVVTSGVYAGLVRIRHHLGTDSQTVDTVLKAEVGSDVWGDDHRLRGLCYTYLRYKTDNDAFAGGLPIYTGDLRGAKCDDPRTGITAWTQNAALITRWYMALDRDRGGLGAEDDELPDAYWIAAANICDEVVALDAGGTEPRYRANGVIDTATEPSAIIDDLLASMAGVAPYVNGQFCVRAGAHVSSVMTINDEDSMGPMEVEPCDSIRDSFNGVKGVYLSPENDWQPSDLPPVKNDTYMAQDGGERIWHDAVFNFVTSAAQGQRLEKIILERSRQGITHTFVGNLKLLDLIPGDVVARNSTRYGWSGKLFEVQDVQLKLEPGNDAPFLGVVVTLRETASGVWSWNSGEETTVDLAPNTNLNDIRSVPTLGSLALSTSNFVQADGTISPRLRLQWTLPSDVFVTSGGVVHIEYKKSADSEWIYWGTVTGNKNEAFITDVLAGVSYDARIQAENSGGFRNATWTTATGYTVLDDQTAPATPSGLTAQAAPGGISLDWDDNGESDLAFYRVYRNTANSFGGATLITTILGSSFVDQRVTYGTEYWYWIKAVDRTNNASAESSVANAFPGEGGAGFWPVDTQRISFGAVTEAGSVRSATAVAIPNNVFTEVTSVAINVPAGYDAEIDVSFDYADDGPAFSTDMDLEVRRSDGSVVDVQRGQSVNQGSTEIIGYKVLDPDLAAAETEYSLWVKPRGGGATATPSIRNPTIGVLVLKDRENGP